MMYADHIHLLPFVAVRAYVMFLLLPLPADVFTTGRKIIISLLLAVLALPYTDGSVSGRPVAYFSEMITGVLLGLPLALTIAFSGMLADIFDLHRGQTFASVYEPTHGPGSQSSNLFRSYMICFLFTVGCGEALFMSFLDSLHDLPAGASLAHHFTEPASRSLLHFITESLEIALTFYLPLAGLLFLIDLCFCFAAKSLPRLQIYNDAFLVKTFLGYFALLLIVQSGYLHEVVVELSRPICKTVVFP